MDQRLCKASNNNAITQEGQVQNEWNDGCAESMTTTQSNKNIILCSRNDTYLDWVYSIGPATPSLIDIVDCRRVLCVVFSQWIFCVVFVFGDVKDFIEDAYKLTLFVLCPLFELVLAPL